MPRLHLLVICLAACGSGDEPTSETVAADTVPSPYGGCPAILYHGGSVVSQPEIINVFWGSYWNGAGASLRGQIDQAWKVIANNRTFYSPLLQYSTNTQHIQPGHYWGAATYNANPPSDVAFGDITSMLDVSQAFGLVPPANGNRIYVVYLPQGVDSSWVKDVAEGQNFDARHSYYNSAANPRQQVYFAGVRPQTSLDKATLFSSHEVDEVIADPGSPNAWDEIGDPCQGLNPRGYRFNGYLVERVYSANDCGCVTTQANPFPSKHDIVWRNSSNGAISLWQMNGSSSVRSFIDLAVQPSSTMSFLGTGDFNGDGEGDLLFFDTATNRLNVWLLAGGTILSTDGAPWIEAYLARMVGIGDFDGDGISDVAWRDTSTGTVTIAWGGGRSGQDISVFNATLDWEVQGIGDFDRDRRSDILWRNQNTGDVAIWFMNGANQPWTPVIYRGVGFDWFVAGVGDFNGDGRADIVWRNTTSGDVAEWQMNGASIVAAPVIVPAVSLYWDIYAVGDIDGDGKDDLVWRQWANGDVGVWLMNGLAVRTMDIPYHGVPGQWWTVGTTVDQTF